MGETARCDEEEDPPSPVITFSHCVQVHLIKQTYGASIESSIAGSGIDL
jgi:hypothetical protein